MPKPTAVAITALLLAACGTSPPARYYALREPAVTTVAKTSSAVVLFGPFDIPQYLRRPQIVVRDTNHELQLHEFDRWAEVPQVAVVPWLAREVDRQLSKAVVVAFPSVGHDDAPYQVRGTISQWDTDASGVAVLVVQWECVTSKDAVVVPLRTSRFTAQAAKVNDYGDIVRALNQALEGFANEVASALSATLPVKTVSLHQ